MKCRGSERLMDIRTTLERWMPRYLKALDDESFTEQVSVKMGI